MAKKDMLPQDLTDKIATEENKSDSSIIPRAVNKLKKFGSTAMDKATDYLDSKGVANPIEVINEELGGETRAESRARRGSTVAKAAGGSIRSSASKRGDGIATKGRTKGRFV